MTQPVSKNQRIHLRAEDLTQQGAGVGHYDGFAVFVPGMLPEEEGEVLIVQVKKQYAYGKLLELTAVSPDRVEPPCLYFPRCGGCLLQHMTYEAQLRWKQKQVYELLRRVGGVTLDAYPPILGMASEERLYYRNKAQFPVRMEEGKLQAGFYAPRSHRLIPIDACRIQSEVSNRLLPQILQLCMEAGVTAYDETTGKGLLRHILIRDGRESGEVLVCFVINGQKLPKEKEMAQALRQLGVTSVSVNTNTQNTNVILGAKTRTIGGPEQIRANIGDLEFMISPQSFFQVNPIQTRRLYETALEMAALTGTETVWDAYCGAGTISLFLARKTQHVYGVEIIDAAIQDARKNACNNGISNVTFFTGEAEKVIPEHYRKTGIRPDVIVVDPPRAGCDAALLDTILQMSPERMVYVSCDPGTLARDVKILENGGMKVRRVQCVDMFPETGHVETVCLLSKLQSKEHIEIEVKMDELDLTSAESKATYEEIREYVFGHTGLKVSHLYIAQVKQKYGIIERENYNKPKSENAKQPQCPPEKEKAITEALKHFGMIL